MVLKRLVSKEIKIVYLDLLDTFGYYRTRPGKEPYVCLSNALLADRYSQLYQSVFNTFLGLYRAGQVDHSEQVTVYYESLVPVIGMPLPEPEIIFIGRAMRLWRFQPREETHVIGRAG